MIRTALMFVFLVALNSFADVHAATTEEAKLLQLAEVATETAVRVRGLEPLRPLTTRVTTREAVESYVVDRLETTGMSAELAATATMLVHFGALPPGTDLSAVLRRVLREQVAGYYDWIEETLFIADWLPTFLQLPTLIHEVTHALQDQHHDLGRFMEPNPGFSEASVAVAALIEGDATLVLMGEVLASHDPEESPLSRLAKRSKITMITRLMRHEIETEPSLQNVPAVLRNMLVFPYVEGLNLAAIVHSEGGWPAIDALYDNPPLSTEQVLHVDKLLQVPRDHPVELHLPAPPSDDVEVLGSDTLGELGIREMLATQLPRDRSSRAAAGWGGDRYLLMGRRNPTPTPAQRWATTRWPGPNGAGLARGLEPTTLCWIAEMDSPEDNEELAAALGSLISPPQHLSREGTRLVAGWGASSVLPAEKCHALLLETRSERVTHYDWYAKRATATPPPAP